jgi:hypothetical protein
MGDAWCAGVHDPDGDGTLKKVEDARIKAREAATIRLSKAKAPDLAVSKLPSTKVIVIVDG